MGHFMEKSGGVAAIVCDTTKKKNTVRQGYCYTCLAIGGGGGGSSVGSLSPKYAFSKHSVAFISL